jgi:hypothetical protein
MAVVENRVVLALGFLDLVQRLCDEEALQAVARHEGERALEKVEPAERRKFVEHEEQPSRRRFASSSSVSRQPIWLRIRRTSGLVRLMSNGGTK